MLFLFWTLLFLVGACLLLLMPAIWGKHIYSQYRHARAVQCPETGTQVSVQFDALRAATTGLSGEPKLTLIDCSRWPERANCEQDCIPEAKQSAPASETPLVITSRRAFPHLPVMISAAAAWVLGMVWHSEYLFRSQWMAALDLSDRQTRDLAEMWSPHILSVAACVLSAYGVAWVTVWLRRRTVAMGLRVAASVWLVMAAIVMIVSRGSIPRDLLRIEGGFTLLAAVLVGAVVGGLPRRVFLKEE